MLHRNSSAAAVVNRHRVLLSLKKQQQPAVKTQYIHSNTAMHPSQQPSYQQSKGLVTRMRRLSAGPTLLALALLIASLAGPLPFCAALSADGLPAQLWQHVLDVEPNRHLQQLGEVSEHEGALTRTYFSPAHRKAAQKILRWMEQAGMTAHIDAIGNVHGVVEGSDSSLGELLVGSHYDTVVDGGKYDGALGVLLGISAVKAVLLEALHRANKLQTLQWAIEDVAPEDDIDLPARAVKGLLRGSVRVVAFCDEEGIRFKSTFLGSRALAGTLLKHKQLSARGADGVTLEELLRSTGVQQPAEAVAALALDPKKVRHYVEFHLEQGPQLEAAGLSLGVVSGIAGQTWLHIAVEGVQNHGGTVPMPMRKDPMSAAAEAVNAIERICTGQPPADGAVDALSVEGQALVCTVGKLDVHPNQVNIIPKWVNFTVDVRSKQQEFRQTVVESTRASVAAICDRRGAKCTITRTHDAPPVLSDESLIGLLKEAVQKAQPLIQQLVPQASSSSSSSKPLSMLQDTVPVMMSGAGHDAMAIADITKIGMVFVRCAGGVSHNPAEFVDPRDVAAAAAAFATFMEIDLLDGASSTAGDGRAVDPGGKDEL